MGLIDNDGERMAPKTHAGTLTYAEHVTRHLAAAPLVAGRRVLDIASGSGYGTHVLSQSAEVDRVLVADGLFVLSTPNDTDAPQGNPFHTHQFVYDDLVDLVRPQFGYVEPYFQAIWKAVVLAPASTLNAEGPFETGMLNLCPLAPEQGLFFYLLCAHRPVTETVEPLLALGEHYSYRLMQEQYVAQAAALNHAATLAADAVTEVENLHRRLATAPSSRPRGKARRR